MTMKLKMKKEKEWFLFDEHSIYQAALKEKSLKRMRKDSWAFESLKCKMIHLSLPKKNSTKLSKTGLTLMNKANIKSLTKAVY